MTDSHLDDSNQFVFDKIDTHIEGINNDSPEVQDKEGGMRPLDSQLLLSEDLKHNHSEVSSSGPKADILRNADGKYSIGLCFLNEQIIRSFKEKKAYFTILLVGPARAGKTTFLNTLFDEEVINNGSQRQLPENIIAYYFEVKEDNHLVLFTVIDIPGFEKGTSDLFIWLPALKIIEGYYMAGIFKEEQCQRSNSKFPIVHCCLYFINPDEKSLSEVDIQSVEYLSTKTTLIPVISKSDSLGFEELMSFKEKIKESFSLEGIDFFGRILDQHVKNDFLSKMPFALIGSNRFYRNETGKLVRGRKYKWGIAEVDNEEHCDFASLKEFLLFKYMLDIISAGESYYETYRSVLYNDRYCYGLDKQKQKKEGVIEGSTLRNLEAFKIIKTILLYEFAKMNIEKSPFFIEKQRKLKLKFSHIIADQEKRFREWKKALNDKQGDLRKDLEDLGIEYQNLQEEVKELEC